MPKLVMLTACEKVIFDFYSKVPSLIGIFQRMNVQIQNAPLPEKAVSPIRWYIFALWQHTDDERDVGYTQHTQIIDPQGSIYAETVTNFKISEVDDYQSKNSVELLGLPITHEGPIKVRVWLDGIDGAQGEYLFFVKHIRSESNEQKQEDKQQPVN